MEKSDFKILIAEDDAMVRDVIVKFLSDEKYPVVVAHDGHEAIKLLRLEEIKLVLTDLRMPGADGMEVLRTAVRNDPNIAVVLLTAYGTLDTALDAMREGAYDYIVKPFVMQQLLLVVRNAFRIVNLVEEKQELLYYLQETYRELEQMKKIGNVLISNDSPENRTRLKELNIVDKSENETPVDTNTSQRESDNLKRYSELLSDLKKNVFPPEE